MNIDTLALNSAHEKLAFEGRMRPLVALIVQEAANVGMGLRAHWLTALHNGGAQIQMDYPLAQCGISIEIWPHRTTKGDGYKIRCTVWAQYCYFEQRDRLFDRRGTSDEIVKRAMSLLYEGTHHHRLHFQARAATRQRLKSWGFVGHSSNPVESRWTRGWVKADISPHGDVIPVSSINHPAMPVDAFLAQLAAPGVAA